MSGARSRLRLPPGLALALALLVAASVPAHADFADAKRAVAKSLASDDPSVRRAAFLPYLDHDGKEMVKELAGLIGREQDLAIVDAAIAALAKVRTPAALEEWVAETRAAKGTKRLLLLLAWRESQSDAGDPLLLEILGGSDPLAAAQAGLALGRRKVAAAAPGLLALLSHKDIPIRAAAARALAALGPAAGKDGLPRLAEALATADGRDRTDLVAALEAISGHAPGKSGLGDDPAAWRAVVEGAAPASVAKAPRPTAYAVGVPIRGRRLVLVLDHSNYFDAQHPFHDRERLQALCKVPDARDVPWFKLKTNGDFLQAHLTRLLTDLPEGRSVGLVTAAGTKVDAKAARPNPATAGHRATLKKTVESVKLATGLDIAGALAAALDAGGGDAVALSSGPDEIVYFGGGIPWLAKVSDPPSIGAIVSVRARLRLVPIHMVGIGEHNFEMFKTIATATGGTWVDLTK